jgi:hypothetical protein
MDLDDVIPHPRYRMCHARVIRAAPQAVWSELHRVTMNDLPLGHALETVRLLPARLSSRTRGGLGSRTFLDVTPIPIVFAEAPHVLIAAGLSQAWRLREGARPPLLDVYALRAWTAPGWIKVGMEYRLTALPDGTRLSVETRILAVDARSQRSFGPYWFLIRPSSGAIRRELLKVVARRAESRRD